jgi:hypothetical protein
MLQLALDELGQYSDLKFAKIPSVPLNGCNPSGYAKPSIWSRLAN